MYNIRQTPPDDLPCARSSTLTVTGVRPRPHWPEPPLKSLNPAAIVAVNVRLHAATAAKKAGIKVGIILAWMIPAMALTDLQIRQAKPGDKARKLSDSRGLYLEIRPTGSRFWRYRYKIAGKENVFAIGEYPAMSLADARAERDKARTLVKEGRHPAHVRQAEKAAQIVENGNTFREVAVEWIASKDGVSSGYRNQLERTLARNFFPYIGKLPIRDVKPALLLECLKRMEKRGARYYAIATCNWLSQLFRYAIRNLKTETNPADALYGAFVRPEVQHSRPMSVEQIGRFRLELQSYGGYRTNVIALELLQLLFVRTVELRRGEWQHVDLEKAVWDIPPEMMKKRRRHLIPLPPRALELLRELQGITGGGRLMFPGLRHPDKPVDGATFNRALERLGMKGFSCHDFRATASTHLYESGLFRGEIIEMQLAHAEANQTKAAYNHAEYLEERTGMMVWWQDYCVAAEKAVRAD